MRSQAVLGVVLILAGLVLLYLLRGVLFNLVVLVIGFLGVLLGFVLVVVGLGMVFWRGRRFTVRL